MATIVSRVSESIVDQTIKLGNEQIARTLSIGSNWRWIRVGVNFQFSGSATGGAFTLSGPNMFVGLTAGTSSLFNSPTTNHWLGFNTDPAVNWTPFYLSDPTFMNDGGNQSKQFTKKENGSSTTLFTENRFGPGASTTGSCLRCPIMIDYIKNDDVSPCLWSVVVYWSSGTPGDPYTGAHADWTSDLLYSKMADETASYTVVGAGANMNRIPFNNTPISESIYGYLDTVNIGWNNANFPLEVSNVAVYRFR